MNPAPGFFNKWIAILEIAFWARKVFGSFDKRVSDHTTIDSIRYVFNIRLSSG